MLIIIYWSFNLLTPQFKEILKAYLIIKYIIIAVVMLIKMDFMLAYMTYSLFSLPILYILCDILHIIKEVVSFRL